MANEAVPGKALVSVDLPKAAHALLFDRHAMLRVGRERDGMRMSISSDGRAVEILVDDKTLATLLKLMAVALADGAVPSETDAQSLRRSCRDLRLALGEAKGCP